MLPSIKKRDDSQFKNPIGFLFLQKMNYKIGHVLSQEIGRHWSSIWFRQSFSSNCSEIWTTHSLMLSETSITGEHLFWARQRERWHTAFSTWMYLKLPWKNKTLSLFENKCNGMETHKLLITQVKWIPERHLLLQQNRAHGKTFKGRIELPVEAT